MKKVLKKLSIMLSTVMLAYTFCAHGQAIKYIDGRFIANTGVHECIKKIVVLQERYKEIPEEHRICFNRINFSFIYSEQNKTINKIEIYVPVIDEYSVVTFFIDIYPKKKLFCIELVNLFLNSNEFNEQDFSFDISNSVNVGGWCGDAINEYDDKYSIATDITEENWREKFLDPHMLWGCGPRSLLFFEIRPDEKVFVEGYDENFDE